MKIVIPTADYPPIEGGIATVTLQVSRQLAALGHDVIVVAPHFSGMEEFDRQEPVNVIRYRGYHLGWFRFIPLFAASVAHLRSAELILGINIAYGGVIGRITKILFDVPYVTFAYAYEFLRFKNVPIVSGLLRNVYHSSAVTIAISEFTRENLESFGVRNDHIEVILPGAPMPESVQEPDAGAVRERYGLSGHPVLLAVGRFIPRKGHLVLIDAFAKILARHPEAVLVMVGRGPQIPYVTRRARLLGVRDRVRMPGRLSDAEVAALYQACTLFVLPTGTSKGGHVEGFGLVFAEAHAHGKPVVAGRSGGVVDAVIDGETGILVEPDDAEGLSSAVLRLLDNPDLAGQMGERGRARVESELNWKAFTERLMEQLERRI